MAHRLIRCRIRLYAVLLSAVAALAAVHAVHAQGLPREEAAPARLAVDGTRGLYYLLDNRRGVVHCIDAARNLVERTLPLPRACAVAAADIQPDSRLLLVRFRCEPAEVVGVNALSGTELGRHRTRSGAAIAGLSVDAGRNRIVLSDGSQFVRVLNGTSLLPLDSIPVPGQAAGAISIDSIREEVAVAPPGPSRGRTALRVVYARPPYTSMRAPLLLLGDTVRRMLSRSDGGHWLIGDTVAAGVNAGGLLTRVEVFPAGIILAAPCRPGNDLIIGTRPPGSGGMPQLHRVPSGPQPRDSTTTGKWMTDAAADAVNSRIVLLAEGGEEVWTLHCTSGELRKTITVAAPSAVADVPRPVRLHLTVSPSPVIQGEPFTVWLDGQRDPVQRWLDTKTDAEVMTIAADRGVPAQVHQSGAGLRCHDVLGRAVPVRVLEQSVGSVRATLDAPPGPVLLTIDAAGRSGSTWIIVRPSPRIR